MAVVPREIYKKIEWHFFNYTSIKQLLKEYEEEKLACAGKTIIDDGFGHGIGRHSDPTAVLGTDMAEGGSLQLKQYRQWIWVIESVMKHYKGTQQGQIIKMYYRDKLSDIEVTDKLAMSRPSFYEAKREIVTMTYAAAIQKKILKVFSG